MSAERVVARLSLSPGVLDPATAIQQRAKKVLAKYPGIVARPLIRDAPLLQGLLERARKRGSQRTHPLSSWIVLSTPPDKPPGFARRLRDQLSVVPGVELAYVEPASAPAPVTVGAADPASLQWYLGPAPQGIDARYAWEYESGDGAEVSFVDVERGWGLPHEDLPDSLAVIPVPDATFREEVHGTHTLGVVLAARNGRGVDGIAPATSNPRLISSERGFGTDDYPETICLALTHLSAGDVLLLEAQVDVNGQLLPVEIAPATFEAIVLATELGVTVIEAAGNGGVNMDAYSDGTGAARGLVLTRTVATDSGAIMVGAATFAPPYQRLGFSNYGTRVDCYAWGQGVPTTEFYTASDTPPEQRYMASFGGTSSAAAIVAGAALSLQGIAKATPGRGILAPLELRAFLNKYGTPTDSNIEPIGTMPDLRKTIVNGLGLLPQPKVTRSSEGASDFHARDRS